MTERSGKVENKKITLITENVGDHRSRIHAADFSIEIRLFVRFRDAFVVKGCTIQTWVRHLRGRDLYRAKGSMPLTSNYAAFQRTASFE